MQELFKCKYGKTAAIICRDAGNVFVNLSMLAGLSGLGYL